MHGTEEAVKYMANTNTVSPDELLAELRKILLDDDAGLNSLYDTVVDISRGEGALE